MANWTRELISRAAMLVLALPLIYGGYRCVQLDQDLVRRYAIDHPQQSHLDPDAGSNALLWFLGRGLILGGAVIALAAFVPISIMERLTRPESGTIYDDTADETRSWMDRHRGG